MMDVMKNKAAGFVAAFTLAALGIGNAEAAEPKTPEVQTAQQVKPLTADFNDHSKGVVFQRNLERDVQDEPLLVKVQNGRYLVHEASGILGTLQGEGVGRLKSYSQEALVKEHGPLENIRTYEQYKADADVLKKTPGLGPKLADSAIDMQTRMRDLEADMKTAGESFTVDQAQKIDQSYTTPVKKDMGMPPPISG